MRKLGLIQWLKDPNVLDGLHGLCTNLTRDVSAAFLRSQTRQRYSIFSLMLIPSYPVFLLFFPLYSWAELFERFPPMPKLSLEMQMLPSGKLQEYTARVFFLDKNVAFIFDLCPGWI